MKRALILIVGIGAVSLVGVGPAYASCVELPPIETSIGTARFVFVGEVISTSSEGRAAIVEVREVWKGDIPQGTVEVVGGEEDPGVATSVDRSYTTDTEYLFVPFDRKGGRFRDNICSATQEYDENLDRLRPASVDITTPGIPEDDSDSGGFPLLPVVGVGVLLVTFAYLTVRGIPRGRREGTAPGR